MSEKVIDIKWFRHPFDRKYHYILISIEKIVSKDQVRSMFRDLHLVLVIIYFTRSLGCAVFLLHSSYLEGQDKMLNLNNRH